MDTMEILQREGIKDYNQIPGNLSSLGIEPNFDIPGPGYHVSVIDMYQPSH